MSHFQWQTVSLPEVIHYNPARSRAERSQRNSLRALMCTEWSGNGVSIWQMSSFGDRTRLKTHLKSLIYVPVVWCPSWKVFLLIHSTDPELQSCRKIPCQFSPLRNFRSSYRFKRTDFRQAKEKETTCHPHAMKSQMTKLPRWVLTVM